MKPEPKLGPQWRSFIACTAILSAAHNLLADTPAATVAPVVPAVATEAKAPASPELKVSVASIAMTTSLSRKGTTATATVTIVSSDGAPVVGALVTGAWSGLTTANSSALTNRRGLATFHSARVVTPGTFTFDLGNVSAAGASYDAAHNQKNRDSIDATMPVKIEGLTLGNDE